MLDPDVIGSWEDKSNPLVTIDFVDDGTYTYADDPEEYYKSGVWECRGSYLLLTADTIEFTLGKYQMSCVIYCVVTDPETELVCTDPDNSSGPHNWTYVPNMPE